MEKALFGAGCFWGIEDFFSKIKGVEETKVGYSGGFVENPSYEIVCQGNTNHIEAVLIIYDENQVSFDFLLEQFWNCHDPTTLNRQGPDIGTQYRSAIFFYNNEQKKLAINSMIKHQEKFNNKIVTEIIAYEKFYLAEDYHQKYIQKTGKYCAS
tara:strand:+ start:3944 stop:4405 length:462 start_codon:yes stop_codon:yes gene_type:complete